MDILNPIFEAAPTESETPAQMTSVSPSKATVSMKNPDVKRRITAEELKAQDPKKPWVHTFEVLDSRGLLNRVPFD